MQLFQKLNSLIILLSFVLVLNLPSPSCSSPEFLNSHKSHKRMRNSTNQLSTKMISDITLHGVLFWASVGFLMPVGILVIRSARRDENKSRAKVLFYIHVILQVQIQPKNPPIQYFHRTSLRTLSALLATAGAVMSLRNLENSFDNGHQKIGLVLYVAIWMQALIGFFRPKRGRKKRTAWFGVHWILGTIISFVGIFNIYTGLRAFAMKTSKSVKLWTIAFTVEVFLMASFYLFQDKWEYMQNQKEVAAANEPNTTTCPSQVISQSQNQKELLPTQCPKTNALKNLFE